MLLKRGEGAFSVFLSFLAGLRTLFYRRFEASKSATIKLPFEKPSVLHCHAVKAWRKVLSRGWRQFLNFWLALEPAFQSEQMARLLLKSFWIHFQKAMLGLQTGQGRAAFRPSLPHCSSTGAFSELATCFCIFRKSFRNSSRFPRFVLYASLRGFALMQALIERPCRMMGRHGMQAPRNKTILDAKLLSFHCHAPHKGGSAAPGR